jgi:hypothetical protein
MGKRSGFPRIPRDSYDTPATAVPALAPHLPAGFRFIEPCAGKGLLIDHLMALGGACVGASDIEPRSRRHKIRKRDALTLSRADVPAGALIITNPPHTRALLHRMIERLSELAPTWLLIDAGWLFTQQAAPFLEPQRNRLRRIVAVGVRPKWIPGTPHNAKDDVAWLKFGRPRNKLTKFYPWQPPSI